MTVVALKQGDIRVSKTFGIEIVQILESFLNSITKRYAISLSVEATM